VRVGPSEYGHGQGNASEVESGLPLHLEGARKCNCNWKLVAAPGAGFRPGPLIRPIRLGRRSHLLPMAAPNQNLCTIMAYTSGQ